MRTDFYVVDGQKIIFDAAFRPLLDKFKWAVNKREHTYYARTCVYVSGKTRNIAMHRLLMGLKAKDVDHINGNGLDNRMENLRWCSQAQNCWNARKRKDSTRPFKGIYFKDNGWHARIRSGGKEIHLGSFRKPELAARAYDSAARRLRGKFAKTNFVD